MNEPEPTMRTEPTIALEPEPHCESDRLREPAATCVVVGVLVEFKVLEDKPTHNPVAETELRMDSADYNYYEDFDMDVLLNLPSQWSCPA